MRKSFALFLCCILSISLSGCANSESNSGTLPGGAAQEQEAAPRETFSTEEQDALWQAAAKLDVFGDATDQIDVVGCTWGTFSNNAVTDMDLYAEVVYNTSSTRAGDRYFTFYLYEYGRQLPTVYSNDDPTLFVKIGDKKLEYKLEFDSANPSGNELWLVDRGSDTDRVFSAVYDALAENSGEVQCVITSWASTYNFTLNGSGFATAIATAEGG